MRVLIVVPLVLFSACAGVEVARVSERLPAKPPGCPVEVLSVAPTRPFREVARLKFEGTSAAEDAYLDGVREEVCRLGGDAAIMQFQYWPGVGGGGGAAVIKWR